MIRFKENQVIVAFEFHPDNQALCLAFVEEFLIENHNAQKKTSNVYTFKYQIYTMDEIMELIKKMEIYVQKSRDTICVWYFLPASNSKSYKQYHTVIGKTDSDFSGNPFL
jgi:hypothetical protein